MKLLWQQIASLHITDILSEHQYTDGVVLDCEHGNFSHSDIYSSLQLINRKNKKSFVRICDIYSDKAFIRYCLDSDVSGLIFANIKNDHQVSEIIKHTYYNPIGARGQGLVRENFWGQKKLGINNKIIVLQIECIDAVLNLDNILRYDNLISYYMIGMYDLSASLGIPGQFDDHSFISCIERIEKKISQDKLGIHLVKNFDTTNYQNYNFVCYGMDTIFLFNSLDNLSNYLTSPRPRS